MPYERDPYQNALIKNRPRNALRPVAVANGLQGMPNGLIPRPKWYSPDRQPGSVEPGIYAEPTTKQKVREVLPKWYTRERGEAGIYAEPPLDLSLMLEDAALGPVKVVGKGGKLVKAGVNSILTDADSIIMNSFSKNMGLDAGQFIKMARKQMGRKQWDTMSPSEKLKEARDFIKEGIELIPEDMERLGLTDIDDLLKMRATDPLDPANEFYAELLRRRGYKVTSEIRGNRQWPMVKIEGQAQPKVSEKQSKFTQPAGGDKAVKVEAPLKSKEITKLAQDVDYRMHKEAISDFKKEGRKYIEGYHVSSIEDATDISKSGIKTGGSWYNRDESVYFFADPDDIELATPYLAMKIEGDKGGDVLVSKFKIPVNDIKQMEWDGFFNSQFETYSGFLINKDIPAKHIIESKRFNLPSAEDWIEKGRKSVKGFVQPAKGANKAD